MSIATTGDGAGERTVYRPRQVRTVGFAIGFLVLGAAVLAAILLPWGPDGGFGLVERFYFLLFGGAIFAFCYREATVRIDATPEHVHVRNLFRSRRLEWAEIIGVSFPSGDPWAHLDLDDGETLAAMTLQRADGAKGIDAARHLARLVRERGEGVEPGL